MDPDSSLEKIKVFSEPKNIEILPSFNIDSFTDCYSGNNTFIIVKSLNNILFLIYSNKNKSILCYDLNENQKKTEIKHAHNDIISCFRHYLDEKQKIDYVMSISSGDNNIKLWNIINFHLILNIQNIYKNEFLFAACFLNNNNNNYVITSNWNLDNSEPIKIFDFHGNLVKEINNSNEATLSLEAYYDENTDTNYIIVGTNICVKSYNFEKNEEYHEYYDRTTFHCNIIIQKEENLVKLIISCTDGYIRIWDFHSCKLLQTITVYNGWLYGMSLWNKDYLLVGCTDKTVRLINLKTGKVEKSLLGHNGKIVTLKKLYLRKYGECLMTQAIKDDGIKLWINKN